MAQYKTMAGRARNSTIPQARVEKRNDFYLGELEKSAVAMFRRMGTDQVDVLIEDPLTRTGISRDLQAAKFSVEMKLDGDKPELVTVEELKNKNYRVSRLKKTPPALPPARGFGVPPPKKR